MRNLFLAVVMLALSVGIYVKLQRAANEHYSKGYKAGAQHQKETDSIQHMVEYWFIDHSQIKEGQ